MIQVGGFEATKLDFDIPAAHGLRQTIGDTLGIGGIFRALRTIPVMLDIGREMTELAPGAWFLNYTNPMAMLCWATYAGTPQQRVVGLCHSVQNTTHELAELVGVPFEDVSFLGGGVNHQAFILRFERDGENLYPLLDRMIDNDPELQRRVRVEMYRRYGYFPTESSEHGAEYLPWVMRSDEAIERYRILVGDYLERSVENLEFYDEMKRQLEAGERDRDRAQPGVRIADHPLDPHRPGAGHLRQRAKRRADLEPAAGACVEVPCLVDKNGVQPDRDRRPAAAAGRAQPHLPERVRADGDRGARSTAASTSITRRCSTPQHPRRSRPPRSTTSSKSCSPPTSLDY